MRIVLIFAAALALSSNTFAQNDFKTLDAETYDYYLKGDYKNLKRSADKLLSDGTDYYYLRMRLGITAFNCQKYSESALNFKKALEFNSLDTLSNEYLYYNYLYSGRKADAGLFLAAVPPDSKTIALGSAENSFDYTVFAGSSASSFAQETPVRTRLYRESLQSTYSFYAGFEADFLKRFSGTLAMTSFTKTGQYNSYKYPAGTDFSLTQAQIYGKLSAAFFPGWEISMFGNAAIYPSLQLTDTIINEFTLGTGISKNWWRIRTGAEFSISNFSNSTQVRAEGHAIWLPQGNLNLYLTTGGMYQWDLNWGGSYQINQEAGYKITKNLWMETGFIMGNSFLYARNQGYTMNNSFQIPSGLIYTSIILPLKKIKITLSPFIARNQNYSWNLNSYTRTGKVTVTSFGAGIKINYNRNQK
jgi:hypothetical protein